MTHRYIKAALNKLFVIVVLFATVNHASAATQVVNVANFSFTPSSFNINLGDTVKYVWVSGSHTTTSLTIPAGASSWNHNINSSPGNTSFTYVPAVSGTYNYDCSIHPSSMIGSFTVTCPPPSPSDAMVVANGPTTFCDKSNVVLSVAKTGLTYLWNTGATSQSITVKTSGTYSCIVSNSCGSTTSNAVTVNVNPLPTSKINAAACSGGSVLLTCSATPNSGVKYKWTKDGATIPGATNPTFLATQSGTYKCKVTITATGCAKNSKGKNVTINCKEEVVNSSLIVYPNPTNEYFNINTSQMEPQTVLAIFDLAGRMIESDQVTGSDMKIGGELAEGIYFLKILLSNKTVQVIKVVKN